MGLGAKYQFQGRHEHSLDSKFRLAIPVSFREVMDALGSPSLWVTNGERWLEVYPAQEWERFMASLNTAPKYNKQARVLKMFYASSAQEMVLDVQGRILIPKSLRDTAKLNRDVIIVGVGATIQIWDRGIWQDAFDQARPNFEDYISSLSEVREPKEEGAVVRQAHHAQDEPKDGDAT